MKKDESTKGRPGLKALREKAGLTQLQLAVQIPVDPSAVRAWENTGAVPGFDKAARLATILGVSLKHLCKEFGIDVEGIPDDKEASM